MRGSAALSSGGAFVFFLLIIPISSTDVNHSLALIFTSTKITTQIPTFQRLFGDPAVYVDRWASGLRSDLGLSLEGLDSSSTANLFGTLTYDYDRQLVFFTDNRQRSLNYGAYVYTNNTNFYALNPTQVSGQVTGMSVDWASYSLYWVDGHYKRICVLSLRLILMWRPIVEGNLTSPQDVAVNPGTGHLFWSDAGPQPRIERSTLEGLERTVLVPSSRLTSPSTLTVDFQGQRLFWLDVGSGAIGSVAFDGTNIKVWPRSGLTTGVMAIYKDFIFIGDKHRPQLTIHRMTDTGLNHSTNFSIEGLNGFIDMTFYSKSNQPPVNSLCAHQNGGCSHFCFTVRPFARRCQCSVGFVPAGPNNINCTTKPFADDFVIVADTMQRNVFQVRPGTGEIRALLGHSDRFPTAVDFDFLHKYVYWVDNKTNAIGKVSLDGRVDDYIYQYASPVAMISGIAVDPAREMLYYTDSGLGRIVQMTTLGTHALIIYTQITASPKSIVIDIKTRRLFWSECGSLSSSIRRADIADDRLENILTVVRVSGVGCPSIAIDTEARKIFWSEDVTGKVWMADDDGSGRTLVYTSPQTLPGAEVNIAIGKDDIFISNTKIQWLTKVNRMNLSSSQQSPLTVFHTPRGIATSDASYKFPETFRDNFLIVVDTFEQRRNLFQIEIESGSMIPLLIDRPLNPVAVAFDELERAVYWTDSLDGFVAKYSLVDGGSRGNSTTVVYREANAGSNLDGIALDAANGKLYLSDAGLHPKILEMNLDGSAVVTVASDGGMKPRALVVNTENRQLYCTDWGDEPGIFRINLRTKARNIIIADNMVWPNALAIDFSEDMMYWADAHIDRIEMAKVDGSGRTSLLTESNAHYFAIALSPQYIYFTDWQHGSVRRMDRRTRQLSEQKPKIFKRLSGIVYYGSTTYNASSVSWTSSSSVSTGIPSTAETTPPASTPPPPSPKDDKLSQRIHGTGASHASIDHTMVIIIAVIVGGVVLIAAMITVGVCVVAKRRRQIDSSQHPAESRYALPDSNRCHATLSSSRSSNTYEYIPAPIDSAGYLNPMAANSSDEDYLKPIGVYYSIKDESDKADLFYNQGYKPFD